MDAGEQQLWVLILCGNHFLSVNAKQLAQPDFQSDPLAGASPATDAILLSRCN